MRRLFNLFSYDKLNTNGIDVEKHRIPYYFDTRDGNGIQYYNGNRKRLNVPATVPDIEPLAIAVVTIYTPCLSDVSIHVDRGSGYRLMSPRRTEHHELALSTCR